MTDDLPPIKQPQIGAPTIWRAPNGFELELRRKPDWRWWHPHLALWALWRWITGGRDGLRHYIDRQTTTVGGRRGRATCYVGRTAEATVRLLLHEAKHPEQIARDGAVRYSVRYTFSPKWRVEYEAEAYAIVVRRTLRERGELAAVTLAYAIASGFSDGYALPHYPVEQIVDRIMWHARLELTDGDWSQHDSVVVDRDR